MCGYLCKYMYYYFIFIFCFKKLQMGLFYRKPMKLFRLGDAGLLVSFAKLQNYIRQACFFCVCFFFGGVGGTILISAALHGCLDVGVKTSTPGC